MQPLRILPLALLAAASVGAAQDRLYTHDGIAPDLGFGFSVSSLADVDGDGVGDYVVGTLSCTSSAGGRVEVISGAAGALLRSHTGTGCFGMSVADVGDVDGDGVGDYAVSAIREHSALVLFGGRVRLYSGASGELLYILEGDDLAGRFGMGLDAAGDVDLDGFPDLAVGSPWESTVADQAGSADVFSGEDGALIRHVDGDAAEDWFGYSVAGIGDTDADGVPELLVGAPVRWYGATGAEPAGYARQFSGATGAVQRTFSGTPPQDHYGTSVAGVGDVDGDGVRDFVIGAPRHRGPAPGSGATAQLGRVELRSGASGALLRASTGTPDSRYGTSVNDAGDLDGDGTNDVLIGACFCQNNVPTSAGSGWVEVRSGTTWEELAKLEHGADLMSFAFALDGLGDLTGDGVPDFVVGNTWDDVLGPKTGSAWVYSGADLALTMGAHELSVSSGGTQDLTLDAGAAAGGALYLVLGSASGTSPGLAVDAVLLPLNVDDYFLLTLSSPNTATHVGTLGLLDAGGGAAAAVVLPAGALPAGAVGLVLHHAFVALGVASVELASNALPLVLLP